MKKLMLVFVLIFSIPLSSSGYWENTHKQITGAIVGDKNTVGLIDLDSYLKALGYWEGIKTNLVGKPIFDWIALGAEREDFPVYLRSANHFHRPWIQYIDQAGLAAFNGESSLIWAFDWGNKQSNSFIANMPTQWNGKYSWHDAIEYYHIGITGYNSDGTLIAPTAPEREEYLAKCFMGLGHLMHLVQDLTVPAHVRDDLHLVLDEYESWAAADTKLGSKGVIHSIIEKTRPPNNYVAPVGYSPIYSLYGIDPNCYASGYTEPHCSMWKNSSGEYQLSDPQVHQYLFSSPTGAIYRDDSLFLKIWGNPGWPNATTYSLPGYVSYNFVTQDTFVQGFQNDDGIPNALKGPLLNGLTRERYIYGNSVSTIPIGAEFSMVTNGSQINRIKVDPYIKKYFANNTLLTQESWILDDAVLKNHAKVLIPKAITYSSAILEKFFRFTLSGNLSGHGAGNSLSPAPKTWTNVDGSTVNSERPTFRSRFSIYGKDANGKYVPTQQDGSPLHKIPFGACYNELLVTQEEDVTRCRTYNNTTYCDPLFVVPLTIKHDLQVESMLHGESVGKGLRLRVTSPFQLGCPTNSALPTAKIEGMIDIFGVDDNNNVVALVTASPWKEYFHYLDATSQYKKYIVKFEGSIDDVPTTLNRVVNEIKEDFSVEQLDMCFEGGNFCNLTSINPILPDKFSYQSSFTRIGDSYGPAYLENLTIENNTLNFDFSMTACTSQTQPVIELGRLSIQDNGSTYTQNTPFTANSKVLFSYDGPAGTSITLSLVLWDPWNQFESYSLSHEFTPQDNSVEFSQMDGWNNVAGKDLLLGFYGSVAFRLNTCTPGVVQPGSYQGSISNLQILP